MAVSLVKIDRACSAVGGIFQIWVQSAAALDSTPAHELGVLLAQSVPEGFVRYQFTRSGAQYQAKDKKSEAGILTEQALQLMIDKTDLTNLRALALLKKVQDPICIFKDKNNQFRLIGTKLHPCIPLADETSGAKIGDRNGFEVSFSAVVPTEAFAYTGELPAAAEIE